MEALSTKKGFDAARGGHTHKVVVHRENFLPRRDFVKLHAQHGRSVGSVYHGPPGRVLDRRPTADRPTEPVGILGPQTSVGDLRAATLGLLAALPLGPPPP